MATIGEGGCQSAVPSGPSDGGLSALFEVRPTGERGRGVFALRPIASGEKLLELQGWFAPGHLLEDDWFAMQVGPDLWLCSHGDNLDDCINHSCDANTGFLTGEPLLYALRDIAAGEELTWDYSTSIAEPGWTMVCLCGAPICRLVARSWSQLTAMDRQRLRPVALAYLRLML